MALWCCRPRAGRIPPAQPGAQADSHRQAGVCRLALRYVSGERGQSYQVSPQWATFTAPAGARGFRTASSRWHLSRARCVAAPPPHRAGCPSRKLAASEPPVRFDANANSSPLPLPLAYPREPLLHGSSVGPGWPPTKAHRSDLPKGRRTSSKERMRQLIIFVHSGGSTQTQQQTWSQSAFLSKRRNIIG